MNFQKELVRLQRQKEHEKKLKKASYDLEAERILLKVLKKLSFVDADDFCRVTPFTIKIKVEHDKELLKISWNSISYEKSYSKEDIFKILDAIVKKLNKEGFLMDKQNDCWYAQVWLSAD